MCTRCNRVPEAIVSSSSKCTILKHRKMHDWLSSCNYPRALCPWMGNSHKLWLGRFMLDLRKIFSNRVVKL